MRIALTGGSGFIGEHIADALIKKGHKLSVLVRRTSHVDRLLQWGVELVQGDLSDEDSVSRLVRGQDVVVHNAVSWSALKYPARHAELNVADSLKLLEFARRSDVGQFIFISSGSVHEKILEDRPLDETHPLWPKNVYGAGKAAVEAFIHAYYAQFGMNTSAWRPTAVYGMKHPVERSTWYDLVRRVVNDERIDEPAGGKWVRAECVAQAISLAAGNPDVAGEVYELTDRHLYVQEIAEMAKEMSGSDADIVDRKGNGPRHTIVTAKAEALGVPLRRDKEPFRRHVAKLLDAISGPEHPA